MGVPYDIVHWPRRRQMIDRELQDLDSDFVALQVRKYILKRNDNQCLYLGVGEDGL